MPADGGQNAFDTIWKPKFDTLLYFDISKLLIPYRTLSISISIPLVRAQRKASREFYANEDTSVSKGQRCAQMCLLIFFSVGKKFLALLEVLDKR